MPGSPSTSTITREPGVNNAAEPIRRSAAAGDKVRASLSPNRTNASVGSASSSARKRAVATT